MKQTIIFILLILFCCKITGSIYTEPQKIVSHHKEVFNYILNYYDVNKKVTGITATNYANRYAEVYTKLSYKYNIPLWLFVKHGKGESGFYPYAKGDYNGKWYESLGTHQIKPKYYTHLLYYVDNKQLGKHIKTKHIKNTSRYFYRIGYNVEMAAMILRNNYDKYGCWELAFLRYGLKTSTFNNIKNDKSKWFEYKFMENIFK